MKIRILLLFPFVLAACSHNPAGPESNPRQYTWEVDTLFYAGSIQTSMRTIWGSSATDVYVAGHSDAGNGIMYHYDGRNWQPVRLFSGVVTIWDIYGFAANDIWAVGEEFYINPGLPLVLHYDGWKWQKVTLPPGGRLLESIGGPSPTNLFAGGINGTLFHYDGTHWQPDSIPFDIEREALPWHFIPAIAGAPNSNDIYLLYVNQVGTNYLLKREGGIWQVIYDMLNNPFSALWLSPWGTLYGTGADVQSWDGSKWNLLFENENREFDTFYSKAMMGAADDNLFIVGYDGSNGIYGKVIHHNGEDWYEFNQFQFPDVEFWDVWSDGKEVFVVGYTLDYPQVTLVLHGK